MVDSLLSGARDVLREPRAYASRLRADDLFRHGSVLAAATVASGGLNYAFQVFVGRALGPAQYGVFGALFSVFYLANVLGLGIQFSSARAVAGYEPGHADLASLHGGLLVRAGLFGLAVAALLAAASPLVAGFLGLSSVWPVVIVAATIPIGFAYRANRGTFQGRQWFGRLGSYNVCFAGAKLAGAVVLILLGYGIYGAFAAVVVAGLLVVAGTTYHLRRRLASGGSPRPGRVEFDSVYSFLSPAILAGFCLTVPANVDVIFVRHAVTGSQAGLYVAAAVLGKMLLFLPMGISKALFPKITAAEATEEATRTDALLDRALTLVAVVAIVGGATFWFAPEAILGVFFGADYAGAAHLVRWYGLAMVPFVLALVFLNFELARDEVEFAYVFAAATVVEIALMWAARMSMVRVIQVILAVNLGLVAYGLYRTKL